MPRNNEVYGSSYVEYHLISQISNSTRAALLDVYHVRVVFLD